jgi:hypothetical protein
MPDFRHLYAFYVYAVLAVLILGTDRSFDPYRLAIIAVMVCMPWMSLLGTKPEQRPEIIRALLSHGDRAKDPEEKVEDHENGAAN